MAGAGDPVLVEVMRGSLVESRHRGAIAVVDAVGRLYAAVGDIEQRVFPRSAVKALQALPLVESGAADSYRFGPRELAISCASHSGEPGHVETVAGMLARAGRSEVDLECGKSMPSNEIAARARIVAGEGPSSLCDNCSGKHAGFICFSSYIGAPTQGYVRPEHPVQREVTAALTEMTGTKLDESVRAIDGCSMPAYAIPLRNIAFSMARLVTGEGLTPGRARAAGRLVEACTSEPWYVGGTGRFDSEIMGLFGGRVFIKGGAEGVYCAGFPELGLGVALKCDDGGGRAAEVVMAVVTDTLVTANDVERSQLARRVRPTIFSRRGQPVGEIRAAEGLAAALGKGAA